jgi:hypothetical protein
MRGEAPVAGRQPDRLGGAADLVQPASGQGAEIDPNHDVRVEQREQCVEVAAAVAAIQADCGVCRPAGRYQAGGSTSRSGHGAGASRGHLRS